MPVEIEFVGGPADGHRVTVNCQPEELPAVYRMPNAGWVEFGPSVNGAELYSRDTESIGPTWHYRYEGRRS